jgi:RNA polymerase sigma-70 factor (ECF subfamily)
VEAGLQFSETTWNEQQVKAALAELPEAERSCLDLFYMKKMTYEEIAAAKQVTTTKVKETLQKGRQELLLKIELLQGVS